MSAIDDAAILKMAEAELLGEAKRAAIRHSTAGISGWQPVPKANKTFLNNTILQTIASNRHLMKRKGKPDQPERKLLQKKNNSDLRTNFVYQKPKNKKEKPSISAKSKDYSKVKSDRESSKNKDSQDKYKVKKVKLKEF